MMSYQNPYSEAVAPSLTPAKREKTDYIINKVIQALDILEQFHDEVDELSLVELSKRLSLNETALRMLIATLKSRYYIEQNSSTNNYRLGFKNLELAQTVLRQTDLYRVSHPVLASVAALCGENTAVAVLRKRHVIELDAIQSEHPVQVVSRVGEHLPVHCTAAGKLLIACQTPELLERLLSESELKGYTRNTITCPDRLRLALRAVVGQGHAVDDGEHDQEVRAVAAPIHDFAGAVVGALVVTGPSCRISLERINEELAELVRNGAGEISARLGFHLGERQPAETPAAPKRPRAPRKRDRSLVAASVAAALPCSRSSDSDLSHCTGTKVSAGEKS
jgi:DNA-binding IclR family transcriptional regulator